MSRLRINDQHDEDFGETLHFSQTENLELLDRLADTQSQRLIVDLLRRNLLAEREATDEWMAQRGYRHFRPSVAKRAAGGIKRLAARRRNSERTQKRAVGARVPSIAS